MKVKKGMVAALALSALPYENAGCGCIVVGPESVIVNLAKAGLVDMAGAAIESAAGRCEEPVIIGIDAEEFAALMAQPDLITEPDAAQKSTDPQHQEGA
ncbi:hypothetical protein [Undibacterium curvum]|uniref:Secreted protein n=1 Tax=Undibacterium curvum TaxID=2762294 RepID=A0ABR7A4Z8_9BURK|nr:hypothetical protein [Undibacterium curvum]MBC3931983.1 hypothetical protein [Undibacterium curvum]